MERMWRERADYGHFFYRIPNGESAADAYDRVSGFNESLWRSFGEEGFASVCVLVTHGLMTRVFLMKWYHFSVEYFEDLRNVDHCEFVVMERSEGSEGKFVLQNRLRTWSELKREKARAVEGGERGGEVPVRRTWSGCLDGYEEGKRGPERKNTADLFMDEVREDAEKEAMEDASRRKLPQRSNGEPDIAGNNDSAIPLGDEEPNHNREHHHPRGRPSSLSTPPSPSGPTDLDAGTALPSSTNSPPPKPPNSTHPTNSKPTKAPPRPHNFSAHPLALQEIGRDGGGSRSGAASRSGSTDSEDHPSDNAPGRPNLASQLESAFERRKVGYGEGGGREVRADALGDQSGGEVEGIGEVGDGSGEREESGDGDEDGDGETGEVGRRDGHRDRDGRRGRDLDERDIDMRDLERREKYDRSLEGSVY